MTLSRSSMRESSTSALIERRGDGGLLGRYAGRLELETGLLYQRLNVLRLYNARSVSDPISIGFEGVALDGRLCVTVVEVI